MTDLLGSLRVAALTLLICVGGYTAAVLAFAQVAVPGRAEGSLIRTAEGTVIGSRLVAQPFAEPGHFWPRPSAVDYDASAAGGSNLSPANPLLAERAAAEIARHGSDAPIPADLVTASGAGLDPHVTLEGALFQVPRVAAARGLDPVEVASLVRAVAARPGGPLTDGRIVNVLELNLALDGLD